MEENKLGKMAGEDDNGLDDAIGNPFLGVWQFNIAGGGGGGLGGGGDPGWWTLTHLAPERAQGQGCNSGSLSPDIICLPYSR